MARARGLFIALEGGDGTGKSGALTRLVADLGAGTISSPPTSPAPRPRDACCASACCAATASTGPQWPSCC